MVILADTSAWVAFLRGTGSPANLRLRTFIETEAEVHVAEPVLLELLAGARSAGHLRRLRQLLHEFPLLRVTPTEGWEEAAAIYRTCRLAGTTPRNLMDCLIAATAIRHDAVLLHEDRDFDAIARHTPLQTLTT